MSSARFGSPPRPLGLTAQRLQAGVCMCVCVCVCARARTRVYVHMLCVCGHACKCVRDLVVGEHPFGEGLHHVGRAHVRYLAQHLTR